MNDSTYDNHMFVSYKLNIIFYCYIYDIFQGKAFCQYILEILEILDVHIFEIAI